MTGLDAILESPRGARMRVRLVGLALTVCFLALAARSTAITLQPAPERVGAAVVFEEAEQRADIIDRNGELLATSLDVYSLFADPRAIWDAEEVAAALGTVFEEINVAELTRRLSNRDRAFVWVRRELTPRQRQAVFELGIEGLDFRKESRRVYPRGSLAGHVLGYSGVDGDGLAGIEFAMDHRLRTEDEPLRLSLDSGVQFALEAELGAAAAIHDVEGAAGIIMHAGSGEILAMASWPPLNPNRARAIPAASPERLNRAATAVYELGSVFKPLTVAAAVEAGAVLPAERFDVKTPLVISGREIEDTHPIGAVASVTDIVAESSNIGTVRIAQKAGTRRLQAFLGDMGLLSRAPVELAGSAAPILPERWDELSAATISYGHGIAVTPLAFLSAFSAFANDGEIVQPSLVLDGRERPMRRVMSAATARLVTVMLRAAVRDGTGTRAEVAGYRVAGKTGTAEKPIPGGYSATENVSSFAAVFPADRPEYALLIVLDTPKVADEDAANGVIGGTVAGLTAAPTAGRLVERIAPLLGVAPRWDSPDGSGLPVRSVSEARSSL